MLKPGVSSRLILTLAASVLPHSTKARPVPIDILPACPCPIRARLRRLAPSYTFTGCLLPQAYGKGDAARNEDEYRVQASPTTPAKLLMLTQGMGRLKGRVGPFLGPYFAFT